MEEKKYTSGEAAAIGILSPFILTGLWIAYFPLTVFAAWCDHFIWNWFAAPYLHLAPMGLWVAVGIGFWVRLQTMSTKMVKDEKTYTWRPIFAACFIHGASLITAYIIHNHQR